MVRATRDDVDSSPAAEFAHLPDGRRLAYAEFGDAGGRPVLYFGSSRLEAAVLDRAAGRTGVRLIGVDRPGMGWSDPCPGRRLLDWPGDIAALADDRALGQFAVVGVSAGGPHALACAHGIAERLTGCAVVSGVGPVTVSVRQRLPWLTAGLMHVMELFFRDEEQARRSLNRFTRGWPEADRTVLADPDVADTWARSLAESFRQGPRGMIDDTVLVESRPWGFELSEVGGTDVHLWHGLRDRDVPAAMGAAIARELPHCRARFLPDDGHLSVVVRHGPEILTTVSGAFDD